MGALDNTGLQRLWSHIQAGFGDLQAQINNTQSQVVNIQSQIDNINTATTEEIVLEVLAALPTWTGGSY